MRNKDFARILQSVPTDYYQKGTRKNPLQYLWHTQKINFCLKLLQTIQFKNCLDVGSASGFMISEISKKYPKVKFYGVDAYKEAINSAKKRYPHIMFKQAGAEKLPFKNNQFDLVICYETIEHVRNPQKAMSEIKRVLKKNGTTILAMDSGNLLFRLIWFFWEKTYGKAWKGAHLNAFHHKDLERLILESKFRFTGKHFTHFGLEVVYVLKK